LLFVYCVLCIVYCGKHPRPRSALMALLKSCLVVVKPRPVSIVRAKRKPLLTSSQAHAPEQLAPYWGSSHAFSFTQARAEAAKCKYTIDTLAARLSLEARRRGGKVSSFFLSSERRILFLRLPRPGASTKAPSHVHEKSRSVG
jgi:hypothetical protein